jgi:23S rRNA pseudouridine2605 synthase
MKEKTTLRVDKFLAVSGLSSRRNTRRFLRDNVLTINGVEITSPDQKVDPQNDTILLNDEDLNAKRYVYYALHKPKNVISTTSDELGREDVTSLIKTSRIIYPVGRLDKDTTGLILLTDDGELTHQLTHPKYHVPKVYVLTISGSVTEEQLTELREGVNLNDGKTLPAEAKIVSQADEVTTIELTIREGRNRQVRRMCGVVGIKLVELMRRSFGPVTLGTMKEKEFRELTDEELYSLRLAIQHQSS